MMCWVCDLKCNLAALARTDRLDLAALPETKLVVGSNLDL
jgi:hypothetical protein